MRTFHRVLSVAVAAAILSTPAIAEELTGTLKKIKDTGTITLGAPKVTDVLVAGEHDEQAVLRFAAKLESDGHRLHWPNHNRAIAGVRTARPSGT